MAKEVIKPRADNGLTYLERASELAQHGLAEARCSSFSLQYTIDPRAITNEQRAKSLVRHLVRKRAWAKPANALEGAGSGPTIFVNQLTGVYRAREHKRRGETGETMKILTLLTLMAAAYFIARGDQHAGCASIIAADGRVWNNVRMDWTIVDDLQLTDATSHRIATLPEKTTSFSYTNDSWYLRVFALAFMVAIVAAYAPLTNPCAFEFSRCRMRIAYFWPPKHSAKAPP
jgi:hypothetical protein